MRILNLTNVGFFSRYLPCLYPNIFGCGHLEYVPLILYEPLKYNQLSQKRIHQGVIFLCFKLRLRMHGKLCIRENFYIHIQASVPSITTPRNSSVMGNKANLSVSFIILSRWLADKQFFSHLFKRSNMRNEKKWNEIYKIVFFCYFIQITNMNECHRREIPSMWLLRSVDEEKKIMDRFCRTQRKGVGHSQHRALGYVATNYMSNFHTIKIANW